VPDLGNRALAQEPAGRQQTLSEIHRNSGDIELQNKVAPFKVFDDLCPVDPRLCGRVAYPDIGRITMIDTTEKPFVDHVIDNLRPSPSAV